jgi:hypothetical protein
MSKSTFYTHGLHESDAIKDALADHRTKAKIAMRRKWAESDNPTLNIALYKLLSDPDELSRLANAKAVTFDIPQQPPQIIIQRVGDIPPPVTCEDDINEDI